MKRKILQNITHLCLSLPSSVKVDKIRDPTIFSQVELENVSEVNLTILTESRWIEVTVEK